MKSNQLKSTKRTDRNTRSRITRQPVIGTTETCREDLPSWLSLAESFTVPALKYVPVGKGPPKYFMCAVKALEKLEELGEA